MWQDRPSWPEGKDELELLIEIKSLFFLNRSPFYLRFTALVKSDLDESFKMYCQMFLNIGSAS